MPTEKDKVTEAAKYAIQMEIDGKAFYLKAAQASSSAVGKNLMESMAKEEDYHRSKFEHVYETACKTGACPIVEFQADNGRTLRTIFARELEKPTLKTAAANSELEAIKLAMDMEDKSHDFYHRRGTQATAGAEKDFYQAVAAEEREHKLILTDYYEYLKDPGGFFVKTEHPSLDG